MLRPFLAAFLCLLPDAGRAQESFSFFLTDAALWKLPLEDARARILDMAYTCRDSDETIQFREPREFKDRKAELAPGIPVWGMKVTTVRGLDMVTLDLTTNDQSLAPRLDARAFRKSVKLAGDYLTKTLGRPGKPWLRIDNQPESREYRTECTRWVGDSMQAIICTDTQGYGRSFYAPRFEVRILPSARPAPPPPDAKPVVVKVDRAAGRASLVGIPTVQQWPGLLPNWAVLEQAIWAVGKASDRSAILEGASCDDYFSLIPYVDPLIMERVARGSGVRFSPLIPDRSDSIVSRDAMVAASKKLGLALPDDPRLYHIASFHPEAVRAALADPAALAAFSTAMVRALSSGQPVIWIGTAGIFPESPPWNGDHHFASARLVSAIDTRARTLTFANEKGAPGVTMELSGALASAIAVFAVSK